MSGKSIYVASKKSVLLFCQSLPARLYWLYYKIIGFGSSYEVYDDVPKKYEAKNIKRSCELAKKLKANLGGTNIFSPLEYVYQSFHQESNHLQKNIFLLTDGYIGNKKETLNLIENNSEKYTVYSIGIGNDFDEELIQNAGIIGKGNYNYCRDIQKLKEIIATAVSNASKPSISNFRIKSNLYVSNLYPNYNIINNKAGQSLLKNKAYNFGYMTKSNINNINNSNNNINLNINYINENNKKINEKYEIIPIELPMGEEFSQLILYNF